MNIEGKNGFINLNGTFGAPSEIIDCNSKYFYQNIELGIRSTVKTLVNNGFCTVSSCQGHQGFNEDRYVVVQVERGKEDFLKEAVFQVHECFNESKMKYICLDKPVRNVHTKDFINPIRLMIVFGKCTDEATRISQKYFEQYINLYSDNETITENDWNLYEQTDSFYTDVYVDQQEN